MIKVLGSFFVIFAGSYIGFSMAEKCGVRLASLRQMLGCIVSLRSCMNYTSMELSDCLVECARGTNQKISGFFLIVASLLKKNYLTKPEEAVAEGLNLYRHQLALKEEDCEVLLLLGANLGKTDKDEQEKYLRMIEKRLELLEREAAAFRDRNSKMYRYMGVCGGLMVVLLLV